MIMKNKETLEKLRTYQIGVIRSVIASRQGRLGTYSADATDRERLALESVAALRENGILVKTYRSSGKRLISLRSAESADLPTVGNIDPIDPAGRQTACAAP